jgi:hypothetical protein
MHNKRKRSVRREIKRMDEKSYRAAEARAIHNIEDGPPDNPRVDRYGYRPDPLPLGDIPCNGKRHSKRKRPKKERCPVNGTHEWYREWIVREDFYVPYHRCEICADRWNLVNWGCWSHGERHHYTERIYLATCIHCWKEKKLKSESDRYRRRIPGYSRWGGRKLVLPKRAVKF